MPAQFVEFNHFADVHTKASLLSVPKLEQKKNRKKTLPPHRYTIDSLVTRLKLTPLCSLHAQKCEKKTFKSIRFLFSIRLTEKVPRILTLAYACAGLKRYHSSVHMEGKKRIFGQWINRV